MRLYLHIVNSSLLTQTQRLCRKCPVFSVKTYTHSARMASVSTNENVTHNNENPLLPQKCLVVGLGNHTLLNTRHSVGMQFVNYLATQLQMTWSRDRSCQAFIAQAPLGPELELYLLKSRHPMNITGKSVAKAVQKLDIDLHHVYIVHDELDKHVGKFAMKEGGSAGGHKGVKSVEQSLRTEDIPRLRIGIDRPASHSEVPDYVLEPFTKEQSDTLQQIFPSCVKLLLHHIQEHLKLHSSLYTLIEHKHREPEG